MSLKHSNNWQDLFMIFVLSLPSRLFFLRIADDEEFLLHDDLISGYMQCVNSQNYKSVVILGRAPIVS